MKKQWILIILCILFIGSIVGCGMIYDNVMGEKNSIRSSDTNFMVGKYGDTVSQEREVEGFDNIALDGVGSVNVHSGEDYKVVVTTDSNLQEKVITKVNGNTLYISESQGLNSLEFLNSKVLTIDVYMPELKNVSLAGLGNIKIQGAKNASELGIFLSGIGSIDAENYSVENADVTLSGVGDISVWVSGKLIGDLSGVGNIDAGDYQMENADVTLSGVGDISVWVSGKLIGNLFGIGDISYKGNPKIKEVNIGGIGDIDHGSY